MLSHAIKSFAKPSALRAFGTYNYKYPAEWSKLASGELKGKDISKKEIIL